jgi:hypothetical protein
MKLKNIAGTAVIAGAMSAGALGIGAGIAQADPGPHFPGPNIPGPNIPGPDIDTPGPPGPNVNPVCWGPGANCFGPGSPLPPGQHGFPPPGHWNDPVRFGLPPTFRPAGVDVDLPVVFNAAVGSWGVFLDSGAFVALDT